MKLKTKFQDEDFELGEVVEARVGYSNIHKIELKVTPSTGGVFSYYYDTLKELNEDWEDYEKAKEKYHWFISGRGTIEYEKDADDYFNRGHKSIGNYFETKEEAEKVVERLRAWKRLKDKGFEFKTVHRNPQGSYNIYANFEGHIPPSSNDINIDLNICFGGEK